MVLDSYSNLNFNGGSRGAGGLVPFFFLQKRSLLAKISIKRVRNLFQNTEVEILETPIFGKLAPSALVGVLSFSPPPPHPPPLPFENLWTD